MTTARSIYITALMNSKYDLSIQKELKLTYGFINDLSFIAIGETVWQKFLKQNFINHFYFDVLRSALKNAICDYLKFQV